MKVTVSPVHRLPPVVFRSTRWLLGAHDMDLVNEYAKKIFMMEKGKVVFEGTPSELFEEAQNNDCLDIPKVIKLALALKEKGINIDITQIHNIDDLVNAVNNWRKHNG